MNGYCIMLTSDVDRLFDSGLWSGSYTRNQSQQSDDGSMIMITGIRNGAVKEFSTAQDMFNYCYDNGWTMTAEEL